MKRVFCLIIICFTHKCIIAQDTTKLISLKEITITASRINSKYYEMPSSVAVVDSSYLTQFPQSNIDNVLQTIAGVYVNRSSGIFSKNSTITMRGFNGSNRVLVLYNDLPLNQFAGGGINWHLFNVTTVDKIEIIKGANSSLFGNNAISGIINIKTQDPTEGFHFNTSMSYASFNTFALKNTISYNNIRNNKGYYVIANLFYRKGDGYYIQNETDTTREKLFLNERGVEIKYKYQFNSKNSILLNYNYYSDFRGDGIKIYEPIGGYYKDLSNLFTATYEKGINTFHISIKGMFHHDLYKQHTEKINKTGDKYKLYDVWETTYDYMFLANAIKPFNDKFKINFGGDFKSGKLNGIDKYYTSTDYIERGGNLFNLGLFAQAEYKTLNKLIFSTSFRFDKTYFYEGYLFAKETTSETNIPNNSHELYKNSNWNGFSTKIGVKYLINRNISTFVSVSTGFTPPKLDDMVSSRKINKGFKIANPYLKPEKVINYELGSSQILFDKLQLDHSLSFSQGRDFQYFITIQPETAFETAIYQRKNIGKVNIFGYEITAKYNVLRNLLIYVNYAYFNPIITEIAAQTDNDKILVGKKLNETPFHQAFAGVSYKSDKFSVFLASNFIGEQWADELNTMKLEKYFTVDTKLQYKIYKGLYLNLLIQNVFNKLYIDKKGGLCPGRFIQAEIEYRF